MEEYMNKNVRPKYVKQKVEFDYSILCTLIPSYTLADDLDWAFRKQFLD